MKYLLLALFLIGCGDDSSTTTITNTTNCYPNIDASGFAAEQAEGSGLTVTRDGNITIICGDQTEINGIISINEPEELADFLATARVQ